MKEEKMTVRVVEAKTTKCPECGTKINLGDVLLICDDNKTIGHLPRPIFDELKKTAEEKGVPFGTFLSEIYNGMMLNYLVKWRRKK